MTDRSDPERPGRQVPPARGSDSSDVVEGEVGSAHLKDPSLIETQDAGADLEAIIDQEDD